MGLQPGSPLVFSINMWGEARGDISFHDRNPNHRFPRAKRTREGGDRDQLLNLHRRMTMLDDCSNSSTALHV
jgi:hypothetical protein